MRLAQDITITLDLTETTPEEYQALMLFINDSSATDVSTHTYDPENYAQDLSLEQIELLKHFD